MSTAEVKEVVNGLDFSKLLDDKFGYIGDGINFFERYGACPGKYAEGVVADQVEKMMGNREYTVQQLYDDTGVTLVLVTTDMNNERSVYVRPNHPDKMYSDIPIYKAVRMSMSLPFLFEPVPYNGRYHVDGGVLDNYAIHLFDGSYPGDPNARLNLCEPNPKVLGLKILTTQEVIGYRVVPEQKIDSVFNYSVSFIDTFMTENDRRVLTPGNFLRTVNIVTDYYPLTSFSLTDVQKQELMDAGVKFTEGYFTEV